MLCYVMYVCNVCMDVRAREYSELNQFFDASPANSQVQDSMVPSSWFAILLYGLKLADLGRHTPVCDHACSCQELIERLAGAWENSRCVDILDDGPLKESHEIDWRLIALVLLGHPVVFSLGCLFGSRWTRAPVSPKHGRRRGGGVLEVSPRN